METKEALLSLLEQNRGTYFSGGEIARRLSVSRTSVWKAVNRLREEGYVISAVPNRGYCLADSTDILSAQGIQKYLEPVCQRLELHVLQETGSTNTLLREKAGQGAAEGCTVIAGSQTSGRGRLGRHFYSPSSTGVYLSLLLRPERLAPSEAVKITTLAAVAACEAIEEVSGRRPGIKWVNDIFMDGKKVSGILTEASLDLENEKIHFIVLGIGINVYPPEGGFPDTLAQTAGTVFSRPAKDAKNHLAAAFLNHFMKAYTAGSPADYVKKYRERSLAIGRRIRVLQPFGSRDAVALDVDDQCRLLVRYEDGQTGCLSSGEISIRLS